MEKSKKQVCAKCGSDQVDVKVWQNINTCEGDGICDDGIYYCNECEEEIDEIVFEEDYDALDDLDKFFENMED